MRNGSREKVSLLSSCFCFVSLYLNVLNEGYLPECGILFCSRALDRSLLWIFRTICKRGGVARRAPQENSWRPMKNSLASVLRWTKLFLFLPITSETKKFDVCLPTLQNNSQCGEKTMYVSVCRVWQNQRDFGCAEPNFSDTGAQPCFSTAP